MHALKIKCIHEKPVKSDGFRIFIDRALPNGLTEQTAHIDLWLHDIAPSATLRLWFNNDIQNWQEFQMRYAKELEPKHALLNTILATAEKQVVSLIYSENNQEMNTGIVLCMQLQFQLLKIIH